MKRRAAHRPSILLPATRCSNCLSDCLFIPEIGFVPHHGGEDGEEFSGAGDEGDFGGFSGVLQFRAVGLEDRIVARRDESREVEGAGQVAATAPDPAFAAVLA